MRAISYNSISLTNANVVISNIQFEDTNRELSIQSFSVRDGGKILGDQFKPKTITLNGYIKASSRSDLDTRIDNLKKELFSTSEADLILEYATGSRRFVCSCQSLILNRNFWNIDYIEFTISFVCSNPPYGQDMTYTSIEYLSLSNTFSTITTDSQTGTLNHSGSIPPYDIIQITVNSCQDLSVISLAVTDANGIITTTEVSRTYSAGDVLEINKETGMLTVNGGIVDYSGGLPRYSLTNNTYSINLTGKNYNVSVKFKYYALWL